jgi:VanZ family protein
MHDSQERASMVIGRAVALGRAWLPVAAWMLVIFMVSARPDEHGGLRIGVVIPKLAHVVEYAILGLLLARATGNELEPVRGRRTLLVLLIIGLYAASDELHQAFVPSREARVTDVLIDIVGGVLGIVVWRTLDRLRRRAGR